VFSYLAFTWDTENSTSARAATDLVQRVLASSLHWHCALTTEGLKVYCSDIRPRSCDAYPVAGDQGVVLGTVFKRAAVPPSPDSIATLSGQDGEAILSSGGRELIDHYWGRYVAFLRTDRPGSLRVVRDPTGALPCFSVVFQDVTVYFSWIEDVVGKPVFERCPSCRPENVSRHAATAPFSECSSGAP
jgi:asparagine synthase (glutamine-hydrolysing)